MSNPRFALAVFVWSCLTLLVGLFDFIVGLTTSSFELLLAGIVLGLSGLAMGLTANRLRKASVR